MSENSPRQQLEYWESEISAAFAGLRSQDALVRGIAPRLLYYDQTGALIYDSPTKAFVEARQDLTDAVKGLVFAINVTYGSPAGFGAFLKDHLQAQTGTDLSGWLSRHWPSDLNTQSNISTAENDFTQIARVFQLFQTAMIEIQKGPDARPFAEVNKMKLVGA